MPSQPLVRASATIRRIGLLNIAYPQARPGMAGALILTDTYAGWMLTYLPGVEEVMGVDAHHSLEQECARDQIREDWMTLCIGPNDLRFG